MSNLPFSIDDETIWTEGPHFDASNPLHRGLQELEQSFRCSICSDFFQSPVNLLPCKHCFCSECIRNHLFARQASLKKDCWCPACRAPVTQVHGATDFKCLTANHAMQQSVQLFQNIRSLLHESLQKQGGGGSEETDAATTTTTTTSARPTRRSTRNSTPPDCETVEKNDRDHHPNSSNVSLDASATTTATAATSYPALTHMKRPLYKSINRKRLRELCDAVGLPYYAGESTEDLIHRHKEFCNLYNAYIDSGRQYKDARTLQQITVQEIVQRQRLRAREQHRNQTGPSSSSSAEACMAQLIQARAAAAQNDQAPVSSGNRVFDHQLNQGFQQLIAQAKARQPKKTTSSQLQESPPSDCPENQNATTTTTTSGTAIITDATKHENGTSSSKRAIASSPSNPGTPPSATTDAAPAVVSSNDTATSKTRKESYPEQQPTANRETTSTTPIPTAPSSSKSDTTSNDPIDLCVVTDDYDEPAMRGSRKRQSPPSPYHEVILPPSITTSHTKKKRLSSNPKWTCTTCTFINQKPLFRNKCEMCETLRCCAS